MLTRAVSPRKMEPNSAMIQYCDNQMIEDVLTVMIRNTNNRQSKPKMGLTLNSVFGPE